MKKIGTIINEEITQFIKEGKEHLVDYFANTWTTNQNTINTINNSHYLKSKYGSYLNYSEDEWNQTKGNYCLDEGIDIMFDDSPRYGIYFETPYFQIGKRAETPESRILEDKIVNLTILLEKQAKEIEKLRKKLD